MMVVLSVMSPGPFRIGGRWSPILFAFWHRGFGRGGPWSARSGRGVFPTSAASGSGKSPRALGPGAQRRPRPCAERTDRQNPEARRQNKGVGPARARRPAAAPPGASADLLGDRNATADMHFPCARSLMWGSDQRPRGPPTMVQCAGRYGGSALRRSGATTVGGCRRTKYERMQGKLAEAMAVMR